MPDTPIEDRLARMLLAAVSEPGDTITGSLIARVGSVETVGLITSRGQVPVRDPVEAELWRHRLGTRMDAGILDRIQHDTERHALRVLTPEDAAWPAELADLDEAAPYALWVSGDPGAFAVPVSRRITMVGARAATPYGEHVATEFAASLAESGSTILSGGAYGIDGAAHRASIAARNGSTVAILATGLDRLYPIGHEQLFERIREGGGALMSELPPGAVPTKWRFVARNRLLAALGGATVVVEAGWRSGSLNTAGHASALGRPVGAVPGPITSAASSGCHRLLRDGIARVVTDINDIRALMEAGHELIDQRLAAIASREPAARRPAQDFSR